MATTLKITDEVRPAMTTVERAVRALLETADGDNWSFEGQTPVEDWALDALADAISGDETAATLLLDRYADAPVEDRLAYVSYDHDELLQEIEAAKRRVEAVKGEEA